MDLLSAVTTSSQQFKVWQSMDLVIIIELGLVSVLVLIIVLFILGTIQMSA